MIVFHSVFTPVLMYGGESWTTTGKDESRMQEAKIRTVVGKQER